MCCNPLPKFLEVIYVSMPKDERRLAASSQPLSLKNKSFFLSSHKNYYRNYSEIYFKMMMLPTCNHFHEYIRSMTQFSSFSFLPVTIAFSVINKLNEHYPLNCFTIKPKLIKLEIHLSLSHSHAHISC